MRAKLTTSLPPIFPPLIILDGFLQNQNPIPDPALVVRVVMHVSHYVLGKMIDRKQNIIIYVLQSPLASKTLLACLGYGDFLIFKHLL